MIDLLDFYAVGETTPTVEFNTVFLPVDEFDTDPAIRYDTNRARTQQLGVWPTIPYEDGMSISIHGSLLADDPVDYVTRRLALVRALKFDPNMDPTLFTRKHGTLHFVPAGETEHWLADVVTTQFSAPVKASEGNWDTTPMMISWFCPVPYFIGQITGDKKMWG